MVHSWRCSSLPSGCHMRSLSASSTIAELGGAADPGGERATHSRTNQSDTAVTSGHSRKRCCIVSYVPLHAAGLTRVRNMPDYSATWRMRQPRARRSRGRWREGRGSQAPCRVQRRTGAGDGKVQVVRRSRRRCQGWCGGFLVVHAGTKLHGGGQLQRRCRHRSRVSIRSCDDKVLVHVHVRRDISSQPRRGLSCMCTLPLPPRRCWTAGEARPTTPDRS